jgi:predicted NBD/HSP70 family sugar kinase
MAIMSRTIIGLDIGGTKTAVVEGSAQAEIFQREEIATEASRPFYETFPRIITLIKKTIEASRQSSRDALAISVSVGGPLKIAEGALIDPPHLPGWRGVRDWRASFRVCRFSSSMTVMPARLPNFTSGLGRGAMIYVISCF